MAPGAIVVHPSLPANNLAELVASADLTQSVAFEFPDTKEAYTLIVRRGVTELNGSGSIIVYSDDLAGVVAGMVC